MLENENRSKWGFFPFWSLGLATGREDCAVCYAGGCFFMKKDPARLLQVGA